MKRNAATRMALTQSRLDATWMLMEDEHFDALADEVLAIRKDEEKYGDDALDLSDLCIRLVFSEICVRRKIRDST